MATAWETTTSGHDGQMATRVHGYVPWIYTLQYKTIITNHQSILDRLQAECNPDTPNPGWQLWWTTRWNLIFSWTLWVYLWKHAYRNPPLDPEILSHLEFSLFYHIPQAMFALLNRKNPFRKQNCLLFPLRTLPLFPTVFFCKWLFCFQTTGCSEWCYFPSTRNCLCCVFGDVPGASSPLQIQCDWWIRLTRVDHGSGFEGKVIKHQ